MNVDLPYRHTQVGKGLSAALLIGFVITLATAFATPRPGRVGAALVALILGVSLVAFRSLTVEVTEELVRVWFGPGWIRKTFSTGEIVDCQPVRNHWIFGWGVRLTPHGWMFNVGGLDAVELRFRSGRRFRIGTDEPEKLCRAIRSAMVSSRSGHGSPS